MAYKEAVTFAATVAGTVEEFDVAAYKAKLAAAFVGWVSLSDIELTVAPASLLVTSRISTPNASAAVTIVVILDQLTANTSLASSVFGVTVEAVQPPIIEMVQLVQVGPPPPNSPSNSPSNSPPDSLSNSSNDSLDDPPTDALDSRSTWIGLAAAGCAVLLCIVFALVCCRRKPRRRRDVLSGHHSRNCCNTAVKLEIDSSSSQPLPPSTRV